MAFVRFAVVKFDPLRLLPLPAPIMPSIMPVRSAPVKLALVAVLLLIITLVRVAPRKSALLYVPEFIITLAKLAELKFAPVRFNTYAN